MQSAGAGGLGPAGVPAAAQPKLSEAQRGAEALFTTKTISEIREIEVRTRKDIEQKKLQLRNLVGDSYRDLIDSADKILSISNNTTTILNNVRAIQDAFTGLAHNFTSSDALLNEKRDSLTKHEELYAVGSRVKYLVDTPELIWGGLDARRYLDAARRYLRAEQVHDLLSSSFSPAVLAKFPLLRHHWPTVTKFKKQVVDAVQAALVGERQLSSDMAADLLGSLAALQGMDAAGLLQAFLTARRTMLGQMVAAASACQGDEAAPAAAALLSAVAQAAQLTVAQVGELFLVGSSAHGGGRSPDATCLLQQRCREEEADSSELLFGGRTNSPSAGGTTAAAAAAASATAGAPEADAWRKTNRGIVERLAALSSGQVEHACLGWLRSVAEDFGAESPRLLSGLASASALVEVEATVRAAIAAWQHPGLAAARAAAAASKRPRLAGHGLGSHGSHGSHAAPHHHPSASTSAIAGLAAESAAALLGVPGAAAAAAAGAAALLDAPQYGSWESVSEWVVGRPLNVWQEVFHQPFVVRSRELIESAFAAVARSLEVPLDACLRAAILAEAEPAGCIVTRSWPMEGWDGGAAAAAAAAAAAGADGLANMPSRGLSAVRSSDMGLPGTPHNGVGGASGDAGDGGEAAGEGAALQARAYRQQVAAIQRRFDDDLRAILQAALLLVGTADANGLPPGVHSTPVSASPSTASLSRAASDAQAPHHHHPRHHSSLHSSAAAIRRDMQGSRAAELEPFVQAKCVELVTSIAAMLQARLEALGAPREGPSGSAAAEQLCLLGRLASALAADSRCLPVVLGPPDAWKAAVTGGAASHVPSRPAGRHAGRGAAANARLAGVLEKLRGAAVAAYRGWATWAAVSLASELRALVLSDELLCSNVVPLSWQETVITSEAENALAEPVADMRFSLPASPSPSVLLLLAAACAETRRAGDTRIAPEALQLFEWELSRALAAAYSDLLHPGVGALHAKGLTEKGVLQLLLDVRFLRDVLVGGRPVSTTGRPGAGGAAAGAPGGAVAAAAAAAAGLLPGGELAEPTVAAALAERKKEATALEQMLQDMLDPIDWATYESYLWAHVGRYFQRVAILYGSLIQLQRAHPEQPAKMGSAGLQESNPLNVLPVAPRFQYLPISAPAASLAQQQQGQGQAGLGQTSGANASSGSLAAARMRPSMGALSRVVSVPGHLAGDATESFSFADLGSARGKAGVGAGSAAESAPSASQGSAASVGAAALSALHARLQAGSLGTFGSLLGDKAAEVTAMAQQRFGDFGDYLPTSALGSAGGLLSSLAKNVVKK
ncbi:hypothetical protein HYH03_009474 [Edaphochlamys debaryana]|uniref:Conserved oligomeric Golgi complex subunit 1 n=1 Tax=Edaphochlamys debaryana TaxID=47281 RepID=A0A835Y492_9CHLO|nr:hypothetical protein HYH03_009474 [Edaphochlamys debaryana]|eukprot:KAG2492230.1 hypothetical protein HYH03_009474 [Edaphochlamys debaryana]